MENLRTDLNSNEKLALSLTGMEGTGQHFILNGQSADILLANEKKERFNDAVQESENRFATYQEAINKAGQDLTASMNNVEIMPMFAYALIKPFDNNPFQKVEVSKTGLITDLGGFAPTYKSNETGETEESKQYIKVGTVVEVGHKCEFLREGDIVFYTIASEVLVPFYKFGFVVVNENRIMAVVNDKLTERRNEFKNK